MHYGILSQDILLFISLDDLGNLRTKAWNIACFPSQERLIQNTEPKRRAVECFLFLNELVWATCPRRFFRQEKKYSSILVFLRCGSSTKTSNLYDKGHDFYLESSKGCLHHFPPLIGCHPESEASLLEAGWNPSCIFNSCRPCYVPLELVDTLHHLQSWITPVLIVYVPCSPKFQTGRQQGVISISLYQCHIYKTWKTQISIPQQHLQSYVTIPSISKFIGHDTSYSQRLW